MRHLNLGLLVKTYCTNRPISCVLIYLMIREKLHNSSVMIFQIYSFMGSKPKSSQFIYCTVNRASHLIKHDLKQFRFPDSRMLQDSWIFRSQDSCTWGLRPPYRPILTNTIHCTMVLSRDGVNGENQYLAQKWKHIKTESSDITEPGWKHYLKKTMFT